MPILLFSKNELWAMIKTFRAGSLDSSDDFGAKIFEILVVSGVENVSSIGSAS